MLYIDFEADRKAYKLRLTTREIISLEKRLGCNPISIFGAGDTLPSITQMVAILHAALQPFHHGITFENALDIFDAYLNDGHTVTDFIPVIIDIYRTGGIIAPEKSNPTVEDDEKN